MLTKILSIHVFYLRENYFLLDRNFTVCINLVIFGILLIYIYLFFFTAVLAGDGVGERVLNF